MKVQQWVTAGGLRWHESRSCAEGKGQDLRFRRATTGRGAVSEGIEIRRTPSLANDQPYLAEGAGARVADIVDRVRAGDSELDVAKDFGVWVESVRLLMEVAEAVSGGEREIARRERKRVHRTENAARKLWEAATENWYETDEDDHEIPLAELLFDSSTALPGIPIKGKDLYRIGVALGFIDAEDESKEGKG